MSKILEKPRSKTQTSKTKRKPIQRISFTPDYIIPVAPGEHLVEKLEEMGMSKDQFAKKTGLAIEAVEMLFLGRLPMTRTLAEKLEDITKMPVKLWLAFEKGYREDLVKASEKYGI